MTSNPLAAEPEDETMDLATSFDNPNHVELPLTGKRSNGPIDTTTYCKRDKRNFGASKPLLNKNEWVFIEFVYLTV